MCKDYCLGCERFVDRPCCHARPEEKESMSMLVQRKIADFRMMTGKFPKYLFIDQVSFLELSNDIKQLLFKTQKVLVSSMEIEDGTYYGTNIKVLKTPGKCIEVA